VRQVSKEALKQAAQTLLEDYFAGRPAEELLEAFLTYLKTHGLGDAEVQSLLSAAKGRQQTLIPVTLFANEELSALELITKYLKENRGLTFHAIALLLKRDDRTIWATYSRAGKKYSGVLAPAPSEFFVPAQYVADRSVAVLESIVAYLHDVRKLRLSEIARLLHRDQSTVWTVYKRALAKKGGAA